MIDRFSLHFWDALIVGAANLCEAHTLLSEDLQAGLEIDGTRIVNPFLALAREVQAVRAFNGATVDNSS